MNQHFEWKKVLQETTSQNLLKGRTVDGSTESSCTGWVVGVFVLKDSGLNSIFLQHGPGFKFHGLINLCLVKIFGLLSLITSMN